MAAGKRRHLIEVQERSTETDAFGESLTTWATLFSTQAGISPLSGRELFAAQAINVEITHQIEVLYRPEWANPKRAAAYRILFRGRIFDIKSAINVDERNREVQIFTSEGLNNG
ncbi:MAG TPA: phage head closure protein [Noviherbaspirillum sp.]|nr:phage head closure protein [Noviherbaspirillum sp.]